MDETKTDLTKAQATAVKAAQTVGTLRDESAAIDAQGVRLRVEWLHINNG